MIPKLKRVIEKEQFGTYFVYNEINKVGSISVRRMGGRELLQTIKFWGNDRLKTFEEFSDACTTWCDQNVA